MKLMEGSDTSVTSCLHAAETHWLSLWFELGLVVLVVRLGVVLGVGGTDID